MHSPVLFPLRSTLLQKAGDANRYKKEEGKSFNTKLFLM